MYRHLGLFDTLAAYILAPIQAGAMSELAHTAVRETAQSG